MMSGNEGGEREAGGYGKVPLQGQARQTQQEQAQQEQGASTEGSPERHGSLEPDDSRLVTGALGGGAVRTPGGADQQQGGERWGGGKQAQGQPGQSQSQGQAFSAEDAARGPAVYHEGEQASSGAGGSEQPQQGGPSTSGQAGSGVAPIDPQRSGVVDQQTAAEGGEGMGGVGEATADQATGWTQGTPQAQQGSPHASQIREHMEVVGADGVHLGTVDKVEGDRIKLIKADSGMGGHQGHHHYIACGLVAGVEGNSVRLSAAAANAYAMEEEK